MWTRVNQSAAEEHHHDQQPCDPQADVSTAVRPDTKRPHYRQPRKEQNAAGQKAALRHQVRRPQPGSHQARQSQEQRLFDW